ncbi:MAG: serine/threonine-protein kinase [Planctomycetaceae bacterium]|nr:serine/threonine-protein kinase [Planctomycetaceae bacterium]
MPKRMIGPFELGDRLGAGGMGIVYRAVYTKTGVPCAIKVLSPDVNDSPQVQQRFEREIAILKKLQHPHIVRYYGGGKVGSQRFYAMEIVQGGSLEALLKQRTRLPWEQALAYTRQIAEALEHAHAAGVIHRDLKPANLLIAPDSKIKLTDFGIARDTTATALTAAGKTVGTYAYMAPEQIRGKPPVDRRTDLYSLGCVLYEMLTGETPFDSDNAGELLVMHLQEEPSRVTSLVPDIPIWVEELVFRLLEKEPEERYYDALALQVAIDEVMTKVSQQASIVGATMGGAATKTAAAGGIDAAGNPLRKKRKKKRDKTPFYERLWFLGLCLLVLIGGVAWTLQPPGEDSLLSKAESLMAHDDPTQWVDAKNKYLPELLTRFPEGKHAPRAQELLDKADMHFAVEQARNRGIRPSKSEGERLFLEADKFERFGDRISALDIYESMVNLLSSQPEERVYVLIAKREIAKITAEGGNKLDRQQFLTEALTRAEDQLKRGKIFDARNTWNSIVTLYADNQELKPFVDRSRERLDATKKGRPAGDQ